MRASSPAGCEVLDNHVRDALSGHIPPGQRHLNDRSTTRPALARTPAALGLKEDTVSGQLPTGYGVDVLVDYLNGGGMTRTSGEFGMGPRGQACDLDP